jgi:cytochrome P450
MLELHSIFDESNRPPNMLDLQEMRYLEQVVKETLRLYPRVPIYGRKLSMDLSLG